MRCQMDLLSSDYVHVVTGNQMKSTWWAKDASNVNAAFATAQGGVLFIDEAYGMMNNDAVITADKAGQASKCCWICCCSGAMGPVWTCAV